MFCSFLLPSLLCEFLPPFSFSILPQVLLLSHTAPWYVFWEGSKNSIGGGAQTELMGGAGWGRGCSVHGKGWQTGVSRTGRVSAGPGGLQPTKGRRPGRVPHFLLTEKQEPPGRYYIPDTSHGQVLQMTFTFGDCSGCSEQGGLQEWVGEVWSPQ